MSLEYLKEAIIRVCLQMNTVINTNSNNFCFSVFLSCPQEGALYIYIYDVQILQLIFTTTTRWTLLFMRFFFSSELYFVLLHGLITTFKVFGITSQWSIKCVVKGYTRAFLCSVLASNGGYTCIIVVLYVSLSVQSPHSPQAV